VIVKEAGN